MYTYMCIASTLINNTNTTTYTNLFFVLTLHYIEIIYILLIRPQKNVYTYIYIFINGVFGIY